MAEQRPLSTLAAPPTHATRVAWCGTPFGDGYRARCSCGWMGKPTPIKAVALVDCDTHEAPAEPEVDA